MLSSLISVSLLATIGLATIDNNQLANTVKSASVNLDGDYFITNVATGQTLSFTRDTSTQTTNLFTDNNPQPISLQTANSNGIDGTVFSGCIGTECKCMSAQWGFQQGQAQSDNAAVSYACQIGSHDHNSGDLHVAKQLWQIVPVQGSTPAPTQAAAQAPPPASSPDTHGNEAVAAGRKRPQVAVTASSGAVNHKDRSTWACQHPAWWLVRHPEYVQSGGHTECASRLAAAAPNATYRSAKRSKHGQVARNVQAQELIKREATMYQIIASDHLSDMTAKAVGSNVISTPGNYLSQNLEDLDQNNQHQMWYISTSHP